LFEIFVDLKQSLMSVEQTNIGTVTDLYGDASCQNNNNNNKHKTCLRIKHPGGFDFILKFTMASSENSNLVTEFEQAFAEAFGTLCEDDPLADKTTHEEQKIVRTNQMLKTSGFS